jgi:hypothetical protein
MEVDRIDEASEQLQHAREAWSRMERIYIDEREREQKVAERELKVAARKATEKCFLKFYPEEWARAVQFSFQLESWLSGIIITSANLESYFIVQRTVFV